MSPPRRGCTRRAGGSISRTRRSSTSRSTRSTDAISLAPRQSMIGSRLVVTKRTPPAPHGLVAAEHPLGARVGARILEQGGNAVDAAVATAFAMTVVEPFMSTIAGGGTMLVHLAARRETVAIDFNVCAPVAAHAQVYRLVEGVSEGALFSWHRVED